MDLKFWLVPTFSSNIGSITSLANISVFSWNFFKPFTANIGLINTYKMPPCLPSYLIRGLSNLTQNIWKNWNSPNWQPSWLKRHRAHLHMKVMSLLYANEASLCWPRQPVWRIWNISNFASQNTQRSNQIRRQTRWHLVATDKTYLW